MVGKASSQVDSRDLGKRTQVSWRAQLIEAKRWLNFPKKKKKKKKKEAFYFNTQQNEFFQDFP